MSAITGKVKNAAWKAALAAMPEIVRSEMGEAVRVTASETVRDAKSRVPVKTGTLKDHIDFSFSPTYARAKVGITPGTIIIGHHVRRVFSKKQLNSKAAKAWRDQGFRTYRASHYAHLVEFGHGGPHGAPPHPFMGPAFRGQQGPFENRMRAAGRATEGQLANIGSSFL